MFDKLVLVRPFCLYLWYPMQRRTVGMQDIPGTEKTLLETEILQHKVSEALGKGNNLEV